MLSFARCPSNRQVGQDTFQDFRTLQHRRIGKLSTEREHVADIVYVNLVASSINFDTCRTWTNAVESDHMGCASLGSSQTNLSRRFNGFATYDLRSALKIASKITLRESRPK